MRCNPQARASSDGFGGNRVQRLRHRSRRADDKLGAPAVSAVDIDEQGNRALGELVTDQAADKPFGVVVVVSVPVQAPLVSHPRCVDRGELASRQRLSAPHKAIGAC
jgi:hypothetical protein